MTLAAHGPQREAAACSDAVSAPAEPRCRPRGSPHRAWYERTRLVGFRSVGSPFILGAQHHALSVTCPEGISAVLGAVPRGLRYEQDPAWNAVTFQSVLRHDRNVGEAEPGSSQHIPWCNCRFVRADNEELRPPRDPGADFPGNDVHTLPHKLWWQQSAQRQAGRAPPKQWLIIPCVGSPDSLGALCRAGFTPSAWCD